MVKGDRVIATDPVAGCCSSSNFEFAVVCGSRDFAIPIRGRISPPGNRCDVPRFQPLIQRSGLRGTLMEIREYRDSDRDALVAILQQNVPRYFAEGDITVFENYLCRRQWDRCYVYRSATGRVIGCAGFYLKSPEVVGLSYVVFQPSTVGSGVIRAELTRYLSTAAAELCTHGAPTLVLNTTPRVARFMKRFGFVVTATVPAGYAEGYDLVHMKREIPRDVRDSNDHRPTRRAR